MALGLFIKDIYDPRSGLRNLPSARREAARLPRINNFMGKENIFTEQNDLSGELFRQQRIKRFGRSLLPNLSNIFNTGSNRQRGLGGR